MKHTLKLSLVVAIGALLLLAISLTSVAYAQEPALCEDPAAKPFTTDIVTLEEMPTPVGLYFLFLVQSNEGKGNSLGLFIAHVDLETDEFVGDGYLVEGYKPSPSQPVTTLTYDMIEVTVALCGESEKYTFAIVMPPDPEPEATPQS